MEINNILHYLTKSYCRLGLSTNLLLDQLGRDKQKNWINMQLYLPAFTVEAFNQNMGIGFYWNYSMVSGMVRFHGNHSNDPSFSTNVCQHMENITYSCKHEIIDSGKETNTFFDSILNGLQLPTKCILVLFSLLSDFQHRHQIRGVKSPFLLLICRMLLSTVPVLYCLYFNSTSNFKEQEFMLVFLKCDVSSRSSE
jgi:hypothetical protein